MRRPLHRRRIERADDARRRRAFLGAAGPACELQSRHTAHCSHVRSSPLGSGPRPAIRYRGNGPAGAVPCSSADVRAFRALASLAIGGRCAQVEHLSANSDMEWAIHGEGEGQANGPIRCLSALDSLECVFWQARIDHGNSTLWIGSKRARSGESHAFSASAPQPSAWLPWKHFTFQRPMLFRISSPYHRKRRLAASVIPTTSLKKSALRTHLNTACLSPSSSSSPPQLNSLLATAD